MDDKKIIYCQLPNETAVYMSYMPFIVNGGIFIRTTASYALGEALQFKLNLLAEPEPYWGTGVVVWITPLGAQGGRPAGIGLQFTGSNAPLLKNKFETILTGTLKSSQLTDTM